MILDETLSSIEVKPSAASMRGVRYEVANGDTIPNLGEKGFKGMSTEGHEKMITAQVCDVNKPLLSVRRIPAAGNKVRFEPEASYIEDAAGHRMWLEERGGMYILKLWVRDGVVPF